MDAAAIQRMNATFNAQAKQVRDLTQLVGQLQTQIAQQNQQIQAQESRLNQLLATVFSGGATRGDHD